MVSKLSICDAVVTVFHSMIWSALGSIICQATFDSDVSGTLLWNFLANDVLHTNNTKVKEDADAIPGAAIFSRAIWFMIMFAFGTTFMAIYFSVAKLFQDQHMSDFKKKHLQNHARLTENMSSGGSVSITVDPDDPYVQLMGNHMDCLLYTSPSPRDRG